MNVVETFISRLLQIINSFGVFSIGYDLYKSQRQTSLTEITKITRVEPLVVISKDCLSVDYLDQILNTLVNVFSAYYLQAAAITAKVDSVKIVKVLDALNPNRDITGFLLGIENYKDYVNLYKDSYKYSLPFKSNERVFNAALESIRISEEDSKGTNTLINEVSNLAVGKILDVRIIINNEKKNEKIDVVIPVLVRLSPSILSIDSILHILALKTEDISLTERFHAWRAGRISFIKDLILCQDLIDEYKKALIKDEDNVLSEITRRANNAKVYGFLSSNPSLAVASNIFIITEEVAKQLELKLGGKLSNPNIRNKAFENTYAMILTVIDRDHDRIVFYYRGIANGSDFSPREIRAINKNNGPDITDILKALLIGNQPTF